MAIIEHGRDITILNTNREREILAAWPKWPSGEYVWLGDRYKSSERRDGKEQKVDMVGICREYSGTCYGQVDWNNSWASMFTPIPSDTWEAIAMDAHDGMTADELAERCRAMVESERADG